MNKILLFALLAFCSCNPMSEVYDALDAAKNPIAKEFDYKMVETDYKIVTDEALKTAKTLSDSTNAKKISDKKNFTEELSVKKYAPAFLSVKFPALGKKSSVKLTYKFYDAVAKKVKDSTDQFVFNGEMWIFDPSVYYTMEKSDYQILADTIAERAKKNVDLKSYLSDFLNQEYYYGANAYKGWFDTDLLLRRGADAKGLLFKDGSGKDLEDDAAAKIIQAKIEEGMMIVLWAKYPDAQPLDGMDLFYYVTYKTSENAGTAWTAAYQCISAGKFKPGVPEKVK